MNLICLAIGHRWRLRFINFALFNVCERCGHVRVTGWRPIR